MKMLNITREDLAAAATQAESIAEMLRLLHLETTPGNYRRIKYLAQSLNVPLPIWDNSKAGPRLAAKNRMSDEEFFSAGTERHGTSLRQRMIARGVPYKCSISECPLSEDVLWCGKPITLQVDHIDGDPSNNVLDNLRFLCANCHSQTDTFSSRNKRNELCECGRKKGVGTIGCPHGEYASLIASKTPKKYSTKQCLDCSTQISFSSVRCGPCEYKRRLIDPEYQAQRHHISWPTVEEIIRQVEQKGFLAYSKELGVSDNAIRKYLRARGVSPLPRKLSKKIRGGVDAGREVC